MQKIGKSNRMKSMPLWGAKMALIVMCVLFSNSMQAQKLNGNKNPCVNEEITYGFTPGGWAYRDIKSNKNFVTVVERLTNGVKLLFKPKGENYDVVLEIRNNSSGAIKRFTIKVFDITGQTPVINEVAPIVCHAGNFSPITLCTPDMKCATQYNWNYSSSMFSLVSQTTKCITLQPIQEGGTITLRTEDQNGLQSKPNTFVVNLAKEFFDLPKKIAVCVGEAKRFCVPRNSDVSVIRTYSTSGNFSTGATIQTTSTNCFDLTGVQTGIDVLTTKITTVGGCAFEFETIVEVKEALDPADFTLTANTNNCTFNAGLSYSGNSVGDYNITIERIHLGLNGGAYRLSESAVFGGASRGFTWNYDECQEGSGILRVTIEDPCSSQDIVVSTPFYLSCKLGCEIKNNGPSLGGGFIVKRMETEDDDFAKQKVNIELKAFPNPAYDNITFEVQGLEEEQQGYIEIYDLNGKMVQQENMQGSTIRVDMTNLQKGSYIARYQSANTVSGSVSFILGDE